ncbi:RWD domain-containing protein 3 isoform X1 [Talpa occidentalis]|uniref:RWD domain-containing protein 3 isoform X1 n=1 Tax=Talpa occidentalis TaxID=50954 RepID=UPI0018909555|nr:RWD domain-containing protein 3 isoform X1 [Talpa occidentalis]
MFLFFYSSGGRWKPEICFRCRNRIVSRERSLWVPTGESILLPSPVSRTAFLAALCSRFFSIFKVETDGTVFRILTKATGHSDVDIPIELVFHLPVNYPSCLPGLSIHSEHLTRAQCVAVKEKLLEQAQNLLSEPMVHELVLWLQQNLRHLLDQPETRNGSEKCALATNMTEDDGLWITLLHLDHMRAKTKYVRTVERWASDLKLTGRLMFMGKIILILLQGDRNSIKEYLILQKTSKVDVDSSGKKCKEKMISVLFETKVQTEHKRFLAFEVKEYSSLDELQKEFETAGLKKLFTEFVFGLVK